MDGISAVASCQQVPAHCNSSWRQRSEHLGGEQKNITQPHRLELYKCATDTGVTCVCWDMHETKELWEFFALSL